MNVTSTAARLRTRLREETAGTILAAAEAVFAEDGIHSARMERIAARAGVAVGTLYNHFADREALLGAVVGAGRASLVGELDGALAAAAGRPVRERATAFLRAVAAHLRLHGRFLAALVEAGEGPAKPAAVQGDLLARAEALVKEGIAAGELRPDPAGVLPLAFMGVARTLLLKSIREGGDLEPAIAALVELFLGGAGTAGSRP
jgi:AcrR family transcriptional regulator